MVYNIIMPNKTHKDKQWRPPIDANREKMVQEIADELNLDGLFQLSQHDVLNMLIDRGYSKMFPDRPLAVKRKKKYIKLDF